MIRLDISYNLKDIVPELEEYIAKLEKTTKKVKKTSHKEYAKYKSFIDYVYKNMTIGGGILDTGYELSAKDKRFIRHFLNKK